MLTQLNRCYQLCCDSGKSKQIAETWSVRFAATHEMVADTILANLAPDERLRGKRVGILVE